MIRLLTNFQNSSRARRDGQEASAVDDVEHVAFVEQIDQPAVCNFRNAKWNLHSMIRGIDGDDDRAGGVAANERELLLRDVKRSIVSSPQRRVSTSDRDERFYQGVQFPVTRLIG